MKFRKQYLVRMDKPDFLVVGAARSGTSALYHYLRQHPDIFLPRQKEPCFFCFPDEKPEYKNGRFSFAVTSSERYKSLFDDADKNQVTGEMSTPYLYLHQKTISSIKKFHTHPDKLKIIILLRNPSERAYSQYMWKLRDGRENLSFDDALKKERQRMKENYSFDYFYAHRGLYYEGVKNYLTNFNSVKIIIYEAFRNNVSAILKDLLTFLNVNDFEFKPRDEINSSASPRYPGIARMITAESKLKFRILNYLPSDFRLTLKQQFLKWNSVRTTIPPRSDFSKKYLANFYKDDIKNLMNLTGLDLHAWLKTE